MAYLGPFAARLAAQPFGCLVLLDEGPYRLERGGVADEFMLPLGLKRSKVDGRIRCRRCVALRYIAAATIPIFVIAWT